MGSGSIGEGRGYAAAGARGAQGSFGQTRGHGRATDERGRKTGSACFIMPDTRQRPPVWLGFTCQRATAWFLEKRMIRHSPPNWVMRQLVGEAMPELEH